MRRVVAALLLTGIVAPVAAQSPGDVQRWQAAQARYQAETDRYYAERDRFYAARARYGDGGPGPGPGYYQPPAGYGDAPPPPPPIDDDRYDPNYDPARYYRGGGQYQERVLAADDRVYRGSDGQYYCKRSDGTTGLIVGAAGGGILGNVIQGGHSRAAGTLIGAAVGALAGRAIDRSNSIRCR